ncbi:mitogen-activated protein kinase kinase kinase 2 [Hordeum vulgare]|nr:mitogen-activated protein kinase kinase kinase 2 [Hordeum vulgare]KAE8766235.1 mitogen-activated protein kinase kinase kinase 2 [Hordeum vulgare]
MSTVGKQWTRVRTLGRGVSGAEVFLAADDASGELFAVKFAAGASSAAALRREQRVMAELRSPRVVSCIGGRAARDGSCQLFPIASCSQFANLHRIGYTQAPDLPEVPESLSADAKDFLARCLDRQASDWCTAAQLLEHPFLASADVGVYAKPQAAESKWVSPKSTLDAAFWETESDTEEAEHEHSRHSDSSVGHSRHQPLQNLASYELLSSSADLDGRFVYTRDVGNQPSRMLHFRQFVSQRPTKCCTGEWYLPRILG